MTSTTSSNGSPTPSALYTTLRGLALAHARPQSTAHLLSLRAPHATHTWGHAALVRANGGLQDVMDNAAFAAHLASTGRYIGFAPRRPPPADKIEVLVDEWERRAVVRMSYWLAARREGDNEEADGDEEVVENDLVWLLRFTEGEGEEVRIVESVEFIDASASARLGTLVRGKNGGAIGDDVRGGITLKE